MNTLRKQIEDKGMTIYEIAKLTGISTATIYKYADAESLNTMPLSTAFKIAKVLGASVEDLFEPFITDTPYLKLQKQTEDKERYEFYKETYMPQSMVIQKATNKSVIESMLGIKRLNNDDLLKVYDYYKKYTQGIDEKAKEDAEHKEVLEKVYNQSLNDLNEIAEEIKKREIQK